MNNQFYYCYSHPQKDFLITHGMRYVIKGIHPNTLKRYWVFDRKDKKLNILLDKWKSHKKKIICLS